MRLLRAGGVHVVGVPMGGLHEGEVSSSSGSCQL
jgi:hypothetical protein